MNPKDLWKSSSASYRNTGETMYGIGLKASAEKDIVGLAPSVRRRILAAIATLGDNPRPPGIRKLEAEGGYRIRVGDYRIVLEIDDDAKLVTIIRVKHRREVYRRY